MDSVSTILIVLVWSLLLSVLSIAGSLDRAQDLRAHIEYDAINLMVTCTYARRVHSSLLQVSLYP